MESLFSPFRVVLFFIVVVVAGWVVLPWLKIELAPKDKSAVLTISFSLPGENPEIVEQSVTALLEGACSQLRQLKKISSVSDYNGGTIQLYFDKTVDLAYEKLELAAMIRRVFPQLPQGVGYPVISGGTNVAYTAPVLVYSVNAPLQTFKVKEQSEAVFQKALAGLNGLKEVEVSGTDDVQLVIRFDQEKCKAWGVDPGNIMSSVNAYFSVSYPGYITTVNNEQYFLQVPVPEASVPVIGDIAIPAARGAIVLLKDLASVYLHEATTRSFFRINGRNAVHLSIKAREGENKVSVANEAKAVVAAATSQLPPDFEVKLVYDDTFSFREEMRKNFHRIGFSVLILLIYSLLFYGNWRNVVNLLTGLMVTFSLVAVIIWAFSISIHLYSVAGLTIAFGVAIDGGVVMLEYCRHRHHPRIFPAVIGAGVMSVTSLCLVFLFPKEEMTGIADFVTLLAVVLSASLAVSLWFTPAMFDLLNHNMAAEQRLKVPFAMKYMTACNNSIRKMYIRTLERLLRFRKVFILLVILSFGLPVFMLPSHLDEDTWYGHYYNNILGSDDYLENIRPYIDSWLGGSLRLFIQNIYDKGGNRSLERTKLYINAELPNGNTIEQMDFVLRDFEKYLLGEKGIDQFVTTIQSGQYGSIEIDFTDNASHSAFPFQLKSRLIGRSLEWGGVDWQIYGAGQGFSNASNDAISGFEVPMKGYNYDELERQANILAGKLARHPQVRKINTNGRLNYDGRTGKEYMLNLDAEKMALFKVSKADVLRGLSMSADPIGPSGQITINHQYYPVLFAERNAKNFSNYDLLSGHLSLDSGKTVRIGDMGEISFQSVSNSIYREDRQYLRVLSFEFMGAVQTGKEYLAEVLAGMEKEMPVGNTVGNNAAEKNVWENKGSRKYLFIFILITAIFFICSIIFESVRKPFLIIAIIPVSFIGLFLTFYIGGFYFDQGGYAAFILLGILVANAAILLVNDFNGIIKATGYNEYNQCVLQAIFGRFRTVSFTNIVVCCIMLLFLTEEKEEVFWLSLAAGTIGGLLFSMFALFVVLPVLLFRKSSFKVAAFDKE